MNRIVATEMIETGRARHLVAWLQRRPHAIHALLFAALIGVLGALALWRSLDFRAPSHPDLLRGRLAHAFEGHYDTQFPIRQLGVNLWAAVDYALFDEGRPGVVIGRRGWLYTDEEFDLAEDAQRQIDRNLALIGWVQRQLARDHVALLVALVPAKARVYPEDLGRRHPPRLRRELYARALGALRSEGVASVGLLAPLSEGKRAGATFLRTDTHWTARGARLAAQAIAADAGDSTRGDETFLTQQRGTRVHRGDLFNFLPLDPWFGWLLPPEERVPQVATVTDDNGGSLLGDDDHTPSIALVGTSYSAEPEWNFRGALEQALHAGVLDYAKDGAGPFAPMLAYLHSSDFRSAPPRLVIWEIPERYLPMRQSLAGYHLPPAAFAAAPLQPLSRTPLSKAGGSSHVTSQN